MLLSARADARAAVKLSDFGLARQAFAGDEALGFSTRLGTPVYAAPELLDAQAMRDGQTYDGFKADLWSLGVTLGELGAPPAHPVPRQRDLLDSRRRLLRQFQGLGAVADAKLRDILADVLQEEPRRRPSAADLHGRLVAADAARRRFAAAVGLL